jgi:ligand-binding SRPBCC domain-containing protein
VIDALRISRQDGDFVLESRLWLERPRSEVFPFFADAGNLDALTPPWLHFRILTPRPIEMRVGTCIDYRLRIHGIPLAWRSEITAYDPPYRFVDEQRRGPYRSWRHEHLFSESGVGTLIEDRVRYRTWGGPLVHALFVRRDLEGIFRFRQERLRERLDPSGSRAATGAV